MELCYPKTKEDLQEYLGEAFHTAFRKATDCPEASQIWSLIRDMPEGEWEAVLQFVALDAEEYGYGLNKLIEQRQELYDQDHLTAIFDEIMAKFSGPINPNRDRLIAHVLEIRKALAD